MSYLCVLCCAVRYGVCAVRYGVCGVCVVQCSVWMCSVRGMCVCVGVMRVCGVGMSVYKKDTCIYVCVSVECV